MLIFTWERIDFVWLANTYWAYYVPGKVPGLEAVIPSKMTANTIVSSYNYCLEKTKEE